MSRFESALLVKPLTRMHNDKRKLSQKETSPSTTPKSSPAKIDTRRSIDVWHKSQMVGDDTVRDLRHDATAAVPEALLSIVPTPVRGLDRKCQQHSIRIADMSRLERGWFSNRGFPYPKKIGLPLFSWPCATRPSHPRGWTRQEANPQHLLMSAGGFPYTRQLVVLRSAGKNLVLSAPVFPPFSSGFQQGPGPAFRW